MVYIYYNHLFMSLLIIPSQSVFDKRFAKTLARVFRKTSIVNHDNRVWLFVTCFGWLQVIVQEVYQPRFF